ncbi:MAG: hypothetical protein GX130_08650 [Candidatus Hydrogenedens sp.]|jgi:hypothetical protein|nr:hypothetical protein [Candidatus Hydrogenedens sp.]
MEQKNNFIEIHKSALADYITFYRDEEARQEAQMSKGEAAAGLLLHTGMLYRYTGSEELISNFLQASQEKRKELALNATAYLLDLDLLTLAENLYSADILEDDLFDQAESLFFRRDELAVMIDLVRSLAFEAIQQEDAAIYPSFRELIKKEIALDRLLRSDPALAELASIPLRALMPLYAPSAIEPHHWWLSSWASDAVEAEAAAFGKSITDSVTDSLSAAKAMFEKHVTGSFESEFEVNPDVLDILSDSHSPYPHALVFADGGHRLHATLAENKEVMILFRWEDEQIKLSIHVADNSDDYNICQVYCMFRDEDGDHSERIQINNATGIFPAEWMHKEGCYFALEDNSGKSDLIIFEKEEDVE